MGIRIVVLDPTAGCPASAVAVQVVGSFRDPAAVKQIAQLVSATQLPVVASMCNVSSYHTIPDVLCCIRRATTSSLLYG